MMSAVLLAPQNASPLRLIRKQGTTQTQYATFHRSEPVPAKPRSRHVEEKERGEKAHPGGEHMRTAFERGWGCCCCRLGMEGGVSGNVAVLLSEWENGKNLEFVCTSSPHREERKEEGGEGAQRRERPPHPPA
jgi:hypothetical protein